MRNIWTIATAGALLALQPANAVANDLDEAAEQIGTLFEQGFDEDGAAARDFFLRAAKEAEEVLRMFPDLDPLTRRDMHLNAANGYYYAADKEHWMALEVEDDSELTELKIDHLVNALNHQQIVFAEGQQDLLVAEYLFGTTYLVEHGIKTDDPRTGEWSAANVHAGRLRIDESKMFGNEIDYGAMSELAVTLLDNFKVTGNTDIKKEADALVDQIPEDERGYDLRERLR